MIPLRPLPRCDRPELLDEPDAVLSDLPANLRDIRRLNRWFGGTSLVLHYLRPVLPTLRDGTILDVATGSADIPLALHEWTDSRGLAVRLTGLDVSPAVLAEGRRLVGDRPIELVRGDARSLPWDDGHFEVVTCCLALHHFVPAEATRVLREAARVARRLVVVTDLRRGYGGYAGVWLATRTVARNRVTRHDGPLSIQRAYTPAELRRLTVAAGLPDARVHRHAMFRQALLVHRGPRHA